jgi:hypothetical protein
MLVMVMNFKDGQELAAADLFSYGASTDCSADANECGYEASSSVLSCSRSAPWLGPNFSGLLDDYINCKVQHDAGVCFRFTVC